VTEEIPTVRARNPTLGAVLYFTGLQYFVVQVIVAARFVGGYSLSRNTISDLGNTSCGTFSDRYVCSPAHPAMNLSFVTLGITVVVGSALVHRALGNTRGVATGFVLFALGGVGVVLVGLFPENTVPALHGIAATLPFLVGNVGVVIVGVTLSGPNPLRVLTLLTGGLSLLALCCYAGGHFLGLGEGGLERVVAYPQTVWQICTGLYLLRAGRRRAVVMATSP
jgi:hypothetical membrane protein